MPKPVLDAVIGHLRLEAEIGGYEAAEIAQESANRTYGAVADLINCTSDEIAVVENATRAWDMAFYSIPFQPGDRILTCEAEYASNYIAYLQVCRRTGARVEVIPSDEHGQISVSGLRDAIDDRVRLISIAHVPTNGGLVNPAEAVGQVAREAGVLYLLDACQSVGQMPIDVERIGCHMLSATGRKFLRGPRGTGFLYVMSEVIEQLQPPFLDLHAARWTERDRYEIRQDAKRFENWETNYAGKIGLGAAVDYAIGWGIEAVQARVYSLAEELRSRLDSVRRVTVRDLGITRCGIVSFTVDGKPPEVIRRGLREQKINVAVSPAEYTLLDMRDRGLGAGVVRASVHYYNNEEEVEAFCRALETIMQ